MLIDGININYIEYGKKKGQPIVLLHGWGQNIQMMDVLGQPLKNDYRIIVLDLPGFGQTSEPLTSYTLNDYYKLLNEFLINLKIKKPILIGHSFGGRLAIYYASKKEVEKLVLLGSPIKSHSKTDSLKVKFLKLCKKIPIINKLEAFAKKHIGSNDYRNASSIMRETLVNIVNENLEEAVKKIKASTILIWGSNDKEALMEDAKFIENNTPDTALIVYDNASHYAYLERLDQTIAILKKFFKESK